MLANNVFVCFCYSFVGEQSLDRTILIPWKNIFIFHLKINKTDKPIRS